MTLEIKPELNVTSSPRIRGQIGADEATSFPALLRSIGRVVPGLLL